MQERQECVGLMLIRTADQLIKVEEISVTA